VCLTLPPVGNSSTHECCPGCCCITQALLLLQKDSPKLDYYSDLLSQVGTIDTIAAPPPSSLPTLHTLSPQMPFCLQAVPPACMSQFTATSSSCQTPPWSTPPTTTRAAQPAALGRRRHTTPDSLNPRRSLWRSWKTWACLNPSCWTRLCRQTSRWGFEGSGVQGGASGWGFEGGREEEGGGWQGERL